MGTCRCMLRRCHAWNVLRNVLRTWMCHNMCGRGANEGSLNGTIEEMVCGCKVGTWVVYTCTALHAGEKNGKHLLLWKRLK
jgi:hypothetical protein